jgi:hypothetical protein
VILFGGLGNQLHQLAVGCFLANSAQVQLDTTSGNPRLVNNRVAIASYVLPSGVELCNCPSNTLRNWIFLFFLKISAKKFDIGLFDTIILVGKKLVGSIRSRKHSIFIAHGVGFDPRVNTSLINRLLVGTFHSYEWASQPLVLQQMRSLRMISEPAWLSNLRSISKLNSPIVVHIRRGDYLAIRELGFLREDYYKKGISFVATKYPKKPIWIFSDQFDGIMDYIPGQFINRVKLINFDQKDAVANLEAMRLGSVFVLSNSTFGWWAATLSVSLKPEVVSPSKWFRSKPNPSMYIPESWILIPV